MQIALSTDNTPPKFPVKIDLTRPAWRFSSSPSIKQHTVLFTNPPSALLFFRAFQRISCGKTGKLKRIFHQSGKFDLDLFKIGAKSTIFSILPIFYHKSPPT